MKTKIRLSNYLRNYERLTKQCAKNKIDIYSAAVSFYIFMSFIPFVIMVLSIIPFLPFSQSDLENALVSITPDDYRNMVIGITDELYRYGAGTFSVSVVVLVWSAAKGVLGITKALNEIYEVEESRNFIIMRIWSMFYTVFLVVAMVLMLVVSVFGTKIIEIVKRYVIIADRIDKILHYKNFGVVIIATFLFTLMFTILPAKKLTFRSQIPGAFISAFIWWLFSWLFEIYISTYKSYSIYGSFATLIIIGIWLYAGMYIMFTGATINSIWLIKKGNKYER